MESSIKNNKIHIHCHIERTAGTSLTGELEKLYGTEHILLYKTQKEKLIRLSEIPLNPSGKVTTWFHETFEGTPILKYFYKIYLKSTEWDTGIVEWYDIKNIPEDIKAISGHYTPDKFSHLENAFFTTVFRDPLERMVSQYLHWKRTGGPGWRVEYPYEDGGFVKYAMWEGHHNFQTKTLGSWSLEDFDLVGVSKHFDVFVSRLRGKEVGKIKKYKLTHANKVAKKPKLKKLGINEEFIKKFREVNSEDYKNYQLALKLAAPNKQ